MCSSLSIFWHCLSLWLEWKHVFQSCGHCWVFQICWHVECSTFTASSFRIWNSSTEIPSPPLTLFVVMLPKGHLTSHSRVSGSRCVITPSWLSGSWRSFCMFLCFLATSSYYLLLPLGPYHLWFLYAQLAWKVALISLSFLKRSLVFPILLFFSISLHWSLRKAFLSFLAIF